MTHWTLNGLRERQAACAAIMAAEPLWRVTLAEPKRSDGQNRAMWSMLEDILRAKPNWYGVRIDKEDLKSIFLAAYFKEVRLVPDLEGTGLLAVPYRSSALSWRRMNEFLEFIASWAAQNGIVLREREAMQS